MNVYEERLLQEIVSSDADETRETLHTDNEMEQSTEEFILNDYEYDVLPSRKRVYNELFSWMLYKLKYYIIFHNVHISAFRFVLPAVYLFIGKNYCILFEHYSW